MEVDDVAPRANDIASASDASADNARTPSTQLRSIVITNFKNYVGEHTIAVDGEAFVCVFGRNGAGKSCVVDAIAFCLGASAQQLRAKRLANLVNDVVVEKNPEAFASVVMCFDVVAAAGEEKEFRIKREVDAATGQSRYCCKDRQSLDWIATSKGALETSMQQLGIDMQLQDRFIIRQANATGLAQMSSLQLLHFCERIIGTSNLKEELVLINRQLKEQSAEVDKLRQDIFMKEEEAMQCQPMVAKFQDWVEKTETIGAALREAKAMLVDVDQQVLNHYRSRSKSMKEEKEMQTSKESDLVKAIEMREKDRRLVVEVFDELQNKISGALQQLRQATRDKAKCSSALNSVTAERKVVEVRIDKLKAEQAQIRVSVNKLDAQSTDDSTLLVGKQAVLRAMEDTISTQQVGTAAYDNEIQKLVREIGRMQATRDEEKAKKRGIQRTKADTERKVTNIEKEMESYVCVKVRHEEEIRHREEALDESLRAVTALTGNKDALRRQAEVIEVDLRQHIQRKAKSSARSRGDKMIQQLQRSLGSHAVLGRLCQLVSTEPKYELAVSSALQSQLQYVVVQDRATAVSVSRAFAQESIGSVSCCVLEDFDGNNQHDTSTKDVSREIPSNDHDPVPLCRVFLCVNDQIRRVLNQFGQNWMICRDSDQVTQLARTGRQSFVTLQGDLFLSDGSIRAFSHRAKTKDKRSSTSSSHISSTHMDEANLTKSISRLSVQLKNCHGSQDQIQQSIEEHSKRANDYRRAIEESKVELKETITMIEAHRKSLDQVLQILPRHELPSDAFVSESEAWEAKLAQLKKRKAHLTKRNGDKERAELLTKHTQMLREIDAISARELTGKANRTKLLGRERAIDHQLLTLTKKLAEMTTEEGYLHNQLEALEVQMAAFTQEVDRGKSELSTFEDRLEALDTELRSLANVLSCVRSEVQQLIKEDKELTCRMASLELEINQFGLPMCDHDDPMEDNPLDQLELQQAKLRVEIKKLDEEQRVMELVKTSISVEIVERAIACEQEIASLQVGLDSSILKLTNLSTRQHETAVARHGKLVAALRVVNENFSRVYRLMNEDGDCYLGYSLERTTLFSDGVTLNCKPDESHWQPFVGLSGGQQVVCAVSLMLALQASFPSPFYVCDEIDAALDTVNVQKLAELLRDQSYQSRTQFLVVSHRPEMWEIAKYLVGIYELEGSAHVVSCRFN